MHYPMRLNIATLGKSSAAEITRVRTLSSMAAFMSLQLVSSYSGNDAGHSEKTFKFPNCEKRCPHVVSLQIYFRFLISTLNFQVALDDLRMVYALYVLACESQDGSFG